MPSNGRKRKRGGGHKKDFRDRAATFTSEDVISKSELEGRISPFQFLKPMLLKIRGSLVREC